MSVYFADENTVLTTKASGTFPNGRYRHALCIVSKGDEGRRLQGERMVPGPWVSAYGLSTSICANPEMGTGAEAQRGRSAGTEFGVVDGDILVIEGELYSVETSRAEQYFDLHRLDQNSFGVCEADRRSRLFQYELDREDAVNKALDTSDALDAMDAIN